MPEALCVNKEEFASLDQLQHEQIRRYISERKHEHWKLFNKFSTLHALSIPPALYSTLCASADKSHAIRAIVYVCIGAVCYKVAQNQMEKTR